jgi:hypothetical protein
MSDFWTEIRGIMVGAGFILFCNLFDAITSSEEKQQSAQQLNRVLARGLRKFPKIMGERRISENYFYTQAGALALILIILLLVIRRAVGYLLS